VTAEADTEPRRGRPRSSEADRAIVDAALELLVEEGINALSMEAVAARAGVGKATIYRRWPGKDALVRDALTSLNDELPQTFAGVSACEQIVDMLDWIRCRGTDTRTSRIAPRLMAYRRSHPELFALVDKHVLEPRRERMRALVRKGIAGGELRGDLDVELTAMVLLSPIVYSNLLGSRARADDSDGLAERVVALVLRGAAADR
jgi:AcrR family transcriptional regulator